MDEERTCAGTPGPVQQRELADAYQRRFHARWAHLRDPHVRSLAWLLDSPDLLDPASPQWQGRIATLALLPSAWLDAWLSGLDAEPRALHAVVDAGRHTRLGRYAETLMAFYFADCGLLRGHGIQVRQGKGETLGEFDFLLATPDQAAVWHCEFATKFYLLQPDPAGHHDDADYFVGPNLADTLGAKMRKILDRQLQLSRHSAARDVLRQQCGIEAGEAGIPARALVKGWLFYPQGDALNAERAEVLGVSADHCRGFWATLGALQAMSSRSERSTRYLILPRLRWMAPARAAPSELLDFAALSQLLAEAFSRDHLPVMVAEMAECSVPGATADTMDIALELRRGFVVPDDWQHRAGLRRVHPTARD